MDTIILDLSFVVFVMLIVSWLVLPASTPAPGIAGAATVSA